jgi:hypothetical protein
MTKPVLVRFRRNAAYPKGAEVVVSSADAATKVYGDAVDILRYEDGSPYDLNLREQAAERKAATEAAKPTKIDAESD